MGGFQMRRRRRRRRSGSILHMLLAPVSIVLRTQDQDTNTTSYLVFLTGGSNCNITSYSSYTKLMFVFMRMFGGWVAMSLIVNSSSHTHTHTHPSWVDPLFWLGLCRSLNQSDLYAHPSEADSEKLLNKFNK